MKRLFCATQNVPWSMQNRSITADGRSFQAYSFLSTLTARPQEIRYVTIHRWCRLISFFPQRRAARGNDTTHLFYKVPLELFSPLFLYTLQKTLKFASLLAQCSGYNRRLGYSVEFVYCLNQQKHLSSCSSCFKKWKSLLLVLFIWTAYLKRLKIH